MAKTPLVVTSSAHDSLALDANLPFLINRAGSLVIQLFSRDLARFGLTVPMWRVLAVLIERGDQRLVDLAILTSIEMSTLSRTISLMHRRKLLSRHVSPSNRREVVISASAYGRKVVGAALPLAMDYEDDLTHGISAADLAAAKRVLTLTYERLLARSRITVPAASMEKLDSDAGDV
jgi:DNA-binding MarR family transcriptional regulator